METDNITVATETIRSALASRSGMQLAGSEIRSIISASVPDFDLRSASGIVQGSGALSAYIKVYLSDVLHLIGKRGGDNLYYVGTDSPENIGSTINLWTAFANYNVGYSIVYDLDSKKVSTRPSTDDVGENQLRISSVTPEELKHISESFVELAPEEIRGDLRQLLDSSEFRYADWLAILRSKSPSAYHIWGNYRIEKIRQLFRSRLEAVGINEVETESLSHQFASEQLQLYRQKWQSASAARPDSDHSTRRTEPTAGSQVDLSMVRNIVKIAVDGMSISELRHISIPIGVLVDKGIIRSR